MTSRRAEFGKYPWPCRRGFRSVREATVARMAFLWTIVVLMGLCISGCGLVNLGKWKGIERTAKDEEYYLVKNVSLTAGSMGSPKESFDHAMHESVNLFFTPRTEPNVYTAESIWYDPAGIEFRTVRQTYDKQKEAKKGDERASEGTTRLHTVSTKELYQHKPGLWTVALQIDGKLARRLHFSVR